MFSKDYEREKQLKSFDNYLNELQEKQCLNEEKIIATKERLEDERKKRPKLNKLLTTKAKDLVKIEKYKDFVYLLASTLPYDYRNYTLLNLINTSIELFKDTSFFSQDNKTEELRGFFAYVKTEKGDVVEQIKMFSFEPDGNQILSQDLTKFLKELIDNFKIVSWSVVPENRANKGYEIALKG